jgi:septum site-determining protein MinC
MNMEDPSGSAENKRILVKGIRDGLLVLMGEGEWEENRQALFNHFDAQAEFLKGARIALDVGSQAIKAVDLGQLRDDFSDRGMSLWAIITSSPVTLRNAQTLGMATRLPEQKKEKGSFGIDSNQQDTEPAVLIHRTLRSGNSIKFAGNVVVIGDVNPGAEIIASGNVVVWGHLRGMVHAGAEGDENAVVCALDLAPTQLRIADFIAITPQRRGKSQPEKTQLIKGEVVAEPWNPKR